MKNGALCENGGPCRGKGSSRLFSGKGTNKAGTVAGRAVASPESFRLEGHEVVSIWRRTTPFLFALLTLTGLLTAPPAFAVDHDNMDGGRPLSFDDAESIAFGERAFEFGFAPSFANGRGGVGFGFAADYLYGFRVNTHFSVSIAPAVDAHGAGPEEAARSRHLGAHTTGGAGTTSNSRHLDAGNISVGVFHNLNRETLTRAAYALRADAYVPTGHGARGAGLRLRGIMSRTFNQFSRLHVNADANVLTNPQNGDRAFAPAVTLGVTRPVGYPTRFNRTGLAEIGARASAETRQGAIFSAGIGVRQQVTIRSVLDLGFQSDFAATNRNAARDNARFVAGYSTQF